MCVVYKRVKGEMWIIKHEAETQTTLPAGQRVFQKSYGV